MYNGHIVISGNWNGTLGDFRRIAVLWRMICLLAAATLVACGGDQTEAPSAPGSSPQPTVMPEQSPVATPTPAGPGVTPADTTAAATNSLAHFACNAHFPATVRY